MVNVPLFCLDVSSVFGIRQSLLLGVDVFIQFFVTVVYHAVSRGFVLR